MATYFQSQALAPATRSSYGVGLRSYERFCYRWSHALWPLSEDVLIRYVSELAQTVSHTTIRAYLAGLQFHSLMHGFSEHIRVMSRLFYTLRGIKRVQGASFSRPRRLPLNYNHLCLIHFRIEFLQFSPNDRLLLRAATALAYFGLLRCSEYTCSSRYQFDASTDLMVHDITSLSIVPL